MDKNAVPVNSKTQGSMRLEPSKAHHYVPLLSWVRQAENFVHWAGPSLKPASNPAELEISLHTNNYESFSLVKNVHQQEELLGFGQIQIWSKRAHLGRLIIAPQHRRKGLSYILINRLMELASQQHAIQSVSLFVYDENVGAKTSYENLGFVPAPYPKGIAYVPDCTFMTLDY
ncbi:GNAT family N-acetyltransferase [Glaciecola sp. SC05]|uniref:GNAT family N-acetyltransferase n=1 Tax=Glaciecola sp. SC05 TaxID=1987355 RepID=UPI0035298DB7